MIKKFSRWLAMKRMIKVTGRGAAYVRNPERWVTLDHVKRAMESAPRVFDA